MNENPLLNALLKSVLDQDCSPVVICDMDSVIRYMNPASIARYHRDLTGTDLKRCHNPDSCRKIERVLAWFSEDPGHNHIYTAFDEEYNTDIYMVALRDESGTMIGYYEKHACRNRETGARYDF